MFDNNMNGMLPAQIGSLSNLTELSLANNAFEGAIPIEFNQLSKLDTLLLFNNKFTGKINPSIQNLPNLLNFEFHNLNEIEASTRVANPITQVVLVTQ